MFGWHNAASSPPRLKCGGGCHLWPPPSPSRSLRSVTPSAQSRRQSKVSHSSWTGSRATLRLPAAHPRRLPALPAVRTAPRSHHNMAPTATEVGELLKVRGRWPLPPGAQADRWSRGRGLDRRRVLPPCTARRRRQPTLAPAALHASPPLPPCCRRSRCCSRTCASSAVRAGSTPAAAARRCWSACVTTCWRPATCEHRRLCCRLGGGWGMEAG